MNVNMIRDPKKPETTRVPEQKGLDIIDSAATVVWQVSAQMKLATERYLNWNLYYGEQSEGELQQGGVYGLLSILNENSGILRNQTTMPDAVEIVSEVDNINAVANPLMAKLKEMEGFVTVDGPVDEWKLELSKKVREMMALGKIEAARKLADEIGEEIMKLKTDTETIISGASGETTNLSQTVGAQQRELSEWRMVNKGTIAMVDHGNTLNKLEEMLNRNGGLFRDSADAAQDKLVDLEEPWNKFVIEYFGEN